MAQPKKEPFLKSGGEAKRRALRAPGLAGAMEFLLQGNLVICELLLVAMVSLVAAEIVLRGIIGFSFQMVDEVSGYMLVAITFLGINASVHSRSVFRVEVLLNLLTERGRVVADLCFCLISLGFVLVLDYQFFRLVRSSFTREVFAPTVLTTPLYIPQLVMPVGMTLLALVLSMQAGGHLLRLMEWPRGGSKKRVSS